MNTGHDGGCGTVHANSVAAVPARIEALAIAGGLTREAALSQLVAALDVVIHLHQPRRGVRRVREIGVLVRDADGEVAVLRALTFGVDLSLTYGPGIGRLEELLS